MKGGFLLRERDVEKRLRFGIQKLGGLCYKFTSPGNAGVPDRIVILPNGEMIFVELKTEIGKISKIQNIQLKRLERHHARVKVLYGAGDVDAFLEWCERYGGCHGAQIT